MRQNPNHNPYGWGASANRTNYMRTPSGVWASPRIRTVGYGFGLCCDLVARNGRIVWSGPVRPIGCETACTADAVAYCYGSA